MLFNIFLEVIMALAMEGSEVGAVINGEIIGNLRFADDIDTLAEKHCDLQDSVNSIFKVGKQLGLAINIDKTETQFLGNGEESFQIFIDGVELKQVKQFVYRGDALAHGIALRGMSAEDWVSPEEFSRVWCKCGHPKN